MKIFNARITTLRKRCLARKGFAWKNACIPRAEAIRQSTGISSWQERQGLCTQNVLANAVFEIDDLEMLAGRLVPRQPEITDDALTNAYEILKPYPWVGGQDGHCEIDIEPVFTLGVDGLSAGIESRMANATGERLEAFRSFLSALNGLAKMIENVAKYVRTQIPASKPGRQKELLQIVEICECIAHRPPRSFRDAIQLLWLVTFAIQYGESISLVSPGHLDRTLAPFYKADIAAGLLRREEALALIECLYLLINEYTGEGLAMAVMVGGRDASGNDITNDLSYLCLEALRRTKLVYPTVGICWHNNTPIELVDLAIDLICKGYSNPAFFNDTTIQHGLKALGVPPEDACNYINSTCVEITPVGASNVWVASPYYNLCGILLEEIAESLKLQLESFDEFKKNYLKRLGAAVKTGVEEQNRLRLAREQRGRKPLQSVFTRDCIGRGKDIDCGGAIYNWVECSFVGLANLADSMYVIREEVFNSSRISLGNLNTLLTSDFKNHESMRQRFLNAFPKYGQDNLDVDAFLPEIMEFLIETCKQFKMHPDDSPFIPGAFVWTMHEQLGRETGATPDGRKAGTPFADGAGPAQGRESKGPTAAILSTTSWDHSPLIGGVAFNMKFSADLFENSPKAPAALRELVLTFLRRGGFETQINVVDKNTLLAARKNPEKYRDLVVRIGGYTDYFTRISPEMQDEIMLRTEYANI